MGEQLVFNGIQFEDLYRSNQVNFRYFENLRYQRGYVFYDGQDYYDVQMRYDLVGDELIVNSKEHLNFFDVQLIREKVQRFRINNKNFIFQPETKNLPEGYYEVAYKDKRKTLLVKYSKIPKKRIEKGNVFYTYRENENYFLVNGEAVVEINDLQSIKKVLDESSEEIKVFLKTNPRNNNEGFRSYVIRLLEYLKKSN